MLGRQGSDVHFICLTYEYVRTSIPLYCTYRMHYYPSGREKNFLAFRDGFRTRQSCSRKYKTTNNGEGTIGRIFRQLVLLHEVCEFSTNAK